MGRFENLNYRDEEIANEMQKQDEEFGVNSKENADNKANPEFDVNKVEQQKETEKKQVEETQEKLDKAKQEIANLENPEKQAEIAAAENSLESDFWPPLDFDDTTEYAQANIGNTEGATSLDQNVEI